MRYCRTDSAESSSERELWLSVFWTAMNDANYVPRKSTKPYKIPPRRKRSWADTKQGEAELARYQARNWLADAGEDFRLVCLLAGLDPEAAKAQAAQPLRRGDRPRWPTTQTAKRTA